MFVFDLDYEFGLCFKYCSNPTKNTQMFVRVCACVCLIRECDLRMCVCVRACVFFRRVCVLFSLFVAIMSLLVGLSFLSSVPGLFVL